MSNYTGVRCPVCSKKFSQADDIVVCPVCGAPHHRECYAEKGDCAFAADHISGNVWRAPQDSQPPPQENKTCPWCKAENPADSIFCQVCGTRMDAPPREEANAATSPFGFGMPGMEMLNDPLYAVYGGVSPEEKIDDQDVRDVAVFVGNSSSYYVPRFKLMSDSGRTIIPNFAAMIFNFFFYFYRKLYLLGVVTMVLFMVSTIPAFLYAKEMLPYTLHEMGMAAALEEVGFVIPAAEFDVAVAQHYMNLSNITRIINVLIGVVLSFCANRFYFDKSMRTMRTVRSSVQEQDEKVAGDIFRYRCAKAGGTSKLGPVLAGLSIVAGYFVASTVIFYMIMGG